MEAFILIGIVIAFVCYNGYHAVSDGFAQAKIGREVERIKRENIESSRRLWDKSYEGR